MVGLATAVVFKLSPIHRHCWFAEERGCVVWFQSMRVRAQPANEGDRGVVSSLPLENARTDDGLQTRRQKAAGGGLILGWDGMEICLGGI